MTGSSFVKPTGAEVREEKEAAVESQVSSLPVKKTSISEAISDSDRVSATPSPLSALPPSTTISADLTSSETRMLQSFVDYSSVTTLSEIKEQSSQPSPAKNPDPVPPTAATTRPGRPQRPQVLIDQIEKLQQDVFFDNTFNHVAKMLDRYILMIQKFSEQMFGGAKEDKQIMTDLHAKLLALRYGKLINGVRDPATAILNTHASIPSRIKLVEEFILVFDYATIKRMGLGSGRIMALEKEMTRNAAYYKKVIFPSNKDIARLLLEIFYGGYEIYTDDKKNPIPPSQIDKRIHKRSVATKSGHNIASWKRSKNVNEQLTNRAICTLINRVDFKKLTTADKKTSKAKNKNSNNPQVKYNGLIHVQENLVAEMNQLLAALKIENLHEKDFPKYEDGDPRFFENLLYIDRDFLEDRARAMVVELLMTFQIEDSLLKKHSIATHALRAAGKISEKEDILLPFAVEAKPQLNGILEQLNTRYRPIQVLLETSPREYETIPQTLIALEEWQQSNKLFSPAICRDTFETVFINNMNGINNQLSKNIHKREFRIKTSPELDQSLQALAAKELVTEEDFLQALHACMSLLQAAIAERHPVNIRAIYQYAETLMAGCLKTVTAMVHTLGRNEDRETLTALNQLIQAKAKQQLPRIIDRDVYRNLSQHVNLLKEVLQSFQLAAINVPKPIDTRTPAEINFDEGVEKQLATASTIGQAYVRMFDTYLSQSYKPRSSRQIAQDTKDKLNKIIQKINNKQLISVTRADAISEMHALFNDAIKARVGFDPKDRDKLKKQSFMSRLVNFILGKSVSLKTILQNFVAERPQLSTVSGKILQVSHESLLNNAMQKIRNLRNKVTREFSNLPSLYAHLQNLEQKIKARTIPVSEAGQRAMQENDEKLRDRMEYFVEQVQSLEDRKSYDILNIVAARTTPAPQPLSTVTEEKACPQASAKVSAVGMFNTREQAAVQAAAANKEQQLDLNGIDVDTTLTSTTTASIR